VLSEMVQFDPTSGNVCVTVVGDQCIGNVNGTLRRYARYLAEAAGVGLLTVRFIDGSLGLRFADATPWPPLDDAVGEAVLAHMGKSAVERQP